MSFQNDRITSIPAPLPLDYDRQYSFTDWETNNPGVPYPASGLEAEFNAIQQALDETQARARLIQDDDGSLLNESVGNDQLKSEVLVGVNAPTVWAPVTSYAVSDTVFESNIWYYCLTAHVSDPSSFATDLGTGKWRELLDLTSVISVEAQNWANYPEDSLVPEGDLVDDYSALHHAAKAEDSATAAAASAAAAASSAADAAADAATIPAPAGGSNGDLIQINSGGTAYEIITPASTNTPSTIVKRNGSGNFQAADPSAAQDVATKNWVENTFEAQTANIADDAVTEAKLDLANIAVPGLVYSASIAAGATIDLPSVLTLGSFSYYRVHLINPEVLTGSADILCRVTDDDGTSYESTGYNWGLSTMNPGSAALAYAEGTAQSSLKIYQNLTNSIGFSSFVLDIFRPNEGTGKPAIEWRGRENWAASAFKVDGTGNCSATGSNPWTGLQFLLTASSYKATGEVRVYGSNVPFA